MESNIPKTYSPEGIEDKWYQKWSEDKCFAPVKDDSAPKYTIIMPPPNVTGRLHMGHALDHSCQDALIRFKRMKGFETLWVPGSDHAGIATQAKVEQKLFKEQNIKKHDLGREKFLEKVWEWKEEHGNAINKQLKKLGVSCDWDYFTFTMDEIPNRSVKKFFVMMYNEGLIYQSDYIINWDPVLQSAISDAEVEHKEVHGNFYHIHYKVSGSNKLLEVATTRPETLFGDVAIAVNPNDDRYEDLIGKMAIIPICNREIPIIADTYVDMDLGTGCLKVTPGHDFNDFEIGQRHNLEAINILNKDGTFNENAQVIEGLNVKKGRKKTVELLEEIEQLIKTESHVHQVGHGDRSGSILEPMISKQWFMNTEKMAARAVAEVESENMKFFPKGWENTYFSWLKNPRPWCISRQLWWGHQIPAYYCRVNTCEHTWASEEEPTACPKCSNTHFEQDPDVLDTWFSSGLFPLNTLGWPDEKVMEEKGFNRYYPTATLVTGFDIIFFWVARMMMMCSKVTEKAPFEHVYIHALVRDKNGKKMSKSDGNVIDPLDIIKDYGCDALRFTLLTSSGYNRNINLDPEKIGGYRNFMNKLWNAFRFIHPFLEGSSEELPPIDKLHHHEKWILGELNNTVKSVNESFEEYRFDDAGNEIYSFVYDKFCSWFIECSKHILHSDYDQYRQQRATVLKYGFKQILKLLHPFSPFITEEIWDYLKTEEDQMLIRSKFPEFDENHSFPTDINQMNTMMETITTIRNLRQSVNLSPKEEIDVKFFTDDEDIAKYYYNHRIYFKELAKVVAGNIKDKSVDRPKKSLFKATNLVEVFIPVEGLIDIEVQVARLNKDLDKTKGELEKLNKKLNNPQFADNAPDHVVDEVKEKAVLLTTKVDSIELNLKNFEA